MMRLQTAADANLGSGIVGTIVPVGGSDGNTSCPARVEASVCGLNRHTSAPVGVGLERERRLGGSTVTRITALSNGSRPARWARSVGPTTLLDATRRQSRLPKTHSAGPGASRRRPTPTELGLAGRLRGSHARGPLQGRLPCAKLFKIAPSLFKHPIKALGAKPPCR